MKLFRLGMSETLRYEKEPGIEVDASTATIRLHDARGKLWSLLRHRSLWLLIAFGLSLIGMVGLWAVWTGHVVNINYRRGTTVGDYGLAFFGGIAGVALAALVAIRPLRRLLHAEADVILSPEGLTDHWLLNARVPWSDIRSVRLVQGHSVLLPPEGDSRRRFTAQQEGIEIEYRDDEAYRARLGAIQRWQLWRYRDESGRVTAVPLSGNGGRFLSLVPADIAWVMRRYCKVTGLPEGYCPQHPALAELSAVEATAQRTSYSPAKE